MATKPTGKPTYREHYKETYEPRRSWVNAEKLPAAMPHLNDGIKACMIEMRAAGKCLLNGKEYEFHDIRVYVDQAAIDGVEGGTGG